MMRRILATTFLVALLGSSAAASARAYDVSDVLAAPFVDNLTASPDGTVLVWKVDASGVRNLYTNAGGAVHALTHYTQDDGQDIDTPQVLPGNDGVVYLHGGVEDNSEGENPNPVQQIPPPERAIFVVPIAGGDPVQLASGNGVVLSPKGDAIAFTTVQGQLGIVTFKKSGATFAAGKPEMVPIRGSASDIAWSPDGTKLAFTSARGDHSFIVIYTPAKHSYVYATPDFTQDDMASWSPDSTRVAFIRMPGRLIGETVYDMKSFDSGGSSTTPWSIWVANANSGNARRIWTARKGIGHAFYPTMSPAQLWWLRGDRIVFPWEGDGWAHLYVVSAGGGAATRLTTGRFEVQTVAESFDRTHLLYSTNEGAIDERHIWSVGLDGRPRALTHGPGNQWSPTPLANGSFAYVNAWYANPPVVTIAGTPAKTLVAVATPANYPAAQMVRPRLITYRSTDGWTIHAQLFVPRGGPTRHAAIVFDHGGPPRQMLAGFHYMEPYTHLYEMNQYLVNRGFVVLSINYRLGIMYGYKFRNPPHAAWNGGAEYQDVLAGAKWLQKQPEVDPNRIGIYGLSYGGLLTALALARNSDIFKVGADFAGVHDWATLFDHDYGHPVGTPEQRKIALMSTAEGYLDEWKSPVFIEQGDDDRNVAFSQGVDLANKLRNRGVTVQTQVFPDETHENQVWAHLVEQYRAAANFLAKYLHPLQ
ncbi:MAG TPA: prolyl oligopeptidase family serine peptidase [Candidatus Baltobacteraceae bacterium]|nr:prolyl oligopeptidase family serine peptidase [Candidatus Baltobacteraceae bacterium]